MLFQIHWWRVVLDEAQTIKNASTFMAHAAHCLQVHLPVPSQPLLLQAQSIATAVTSIILMGIALAGTKHHSHCTLW